VIDSDGDIPLATVHELLKDYKFMTYTTKRHTEEVNRFRIIIPINYTLELDQDEYKEFMNSFMNWLPFKTDEAANQRAKKWETFDGGHHYYSDGTDIVDALKFVPKTSKNEQHKQSVSQLESLDNLERWFAQRIASGNRNNQLIKFALALADSGMGYVEVEQKLLHFNNRLANGLAEDEIRSTILQTVAKHIN